MEKIIRYTLGSLLMIVALNAFGGGYYGMAGAKDVPIELLEGSPFKDYFIPGLFLFVFVGGSALISSVAVFKRHPVARRVSFLCGFIILVWIAVQVAIIGYVSWMQPATTIAGIIILFLTYLLPQRKAFI
ncbi:MAG: hypothetical protein KG029_11785 [Bacteroidetes bacterium]|nr:hypothetical protein [Bacteroidota bacterium]